MRIYLSEICIIFLGYNGMQLNNCQWNYIAFKYLTNLMQNIALPTGINEH